MKKFKRIICVDFDGVIHSYTSGWQGVGVISDPPVPGAIAWLKNHLQEPDCLGMSFYDGPEAQIYSTRSKSWQGRRAMKKWLIKHGLHRAYFTERILKFPKKKPTAFLTIDDRAICFEGTFPTTQEMLDFKPWYKKPDPPQQMLKGPWWCKDCKKVIPDKRIHGSAQWGYYHLPGVSKLAHDVEWHSHPPEDSDE